MAYTDFNLEEVLGSVERSRYQTFAEVNHETLQRSLKDFVMNLLKDAYNEAVQNGITEFGDYQSAKMVGPANKVRTAIYKNIPYFYSILGCIKPEETSYVTVNLYAYAGGDSGLYISAVIKGLREIEYKYMYPETVEEDEPVIEPDKIKLRFSCIGCSISETESYTELGVPNVRSFNTEQMELSDSVAVGSHMVYHVQPMTGYSVTRIVIDGISYTDVKAVNDLPGFTVAEYSLGYEMLVTDTSDDHDIVFVCDYDARVISRQIEVTAIKCTGVFYDNPRLTPYTVGADDNTSSSFVIMDGERFVVKFTPINHTKLKHVIIDGRDYIDEYIEGKMFNYDGKTSDGNIFDISISSIEIGDYQVNDAVEIIIPIIGMDHTIEVEYEYADYHIRGFIVSPLGDVLEKFLDTEMKYTETISTIAAYQAISSYEDYRFSRGVVRDPITNKTLRDTEINVEFYPITNSALKVSKPTCDADIYLLLENKPKTCVITGEAVHGIILYSGSIVDTHNTSVVTTEPIEFGKSAIFRITANADYMFTNQAPNFGARILIDGNEPDMAELAERNIELSYINEESIMIGFLQLNGDHTFRVELNTKRPKFNVTFNGEHTLNGETTEYVHDVTTFSVLESGSAAVHYVAASGYELPINDGELDLTKCEIFVNNVSVDVISVLPTQYGGAKVSFNLDTDSLYVEVTNATEDVTVTFNLKEESKIPKEYNVVVNGINCLVEGSAYKNKVVNENESVSFIINPEPDKEIPLTDQGALDFDYIRVKMAKRLYTQLEYSDLTLISPDNFPENISFVYSSEEATLIVSDVNSDYAFEVIINYPEPPAPPEEPTKYTVEVIETNVTIDQENPTEVEEGSDLDIVIDANKGTTFENIMFILDEGTDHEYRWAIDLDQDSFNIFDREIEGTPQIENDGTVVCTREDNHYVYTVHLKDIRNNYVIRFSTVNIDVGQ